MEEQKVKEREKQGEVEEEQVEQEEAKEEVERRISSALGFTHSTLSI